MQVVRLLLYFVFSGIAQVERYRDSAVTPFEGIVVLEVFSSTCGVG